MTTQTTTATQPAKTSKLGRRTLKTQGRKKRKLKLAGDKEFAKTFFAAKSKRSTEKKAAFRKKKSRKK
ncbi:MAG TPA: hypothetical protein DCS07_12035 [Bdellovibrionales bacterium]|nr:MAG: hypothetical protein A2Z97_13365 [Bdellovibrionales bacterium GWB1_52_6]OFZ03158.1 MAG: hypothetical protein A2X97_04035 [Bdellovibrionales bacterium GWA1_52_35]OFZ43662.1 MAG: hypothetical protein A2070_04505 [Bdellovibrionales bacterium GWC1_52_8]HAR43338.1 hypothetical protein [Bdellovibrionales bacterium]HCM38349.1 hypothetical protein [Bdellovibrionales bacterium]